MLLERQEQQKAPLGLEASRMVDRKKPSFVVSSCCHAHSQKLMSLMAEEYINLRENQETSRQACVCLCVDGVPGQQSCTHHFTPWKSPCVDGAGVRQAVGIVYPEFWSGHSITLYSTPGWTEDQLQKMGLLTWLLGWVVDLLSLTARSLGRTCKPIRTDYRNLQT